MQDYAGRLQHILTEARRLEADALTDMRAAEDAYLRTECANETIAQATRSLHREIGEAVRELTDAVRSAVLLQRRVSEQA